VPKIQSDKRNTTHQKTMLPAVRSTQPRKPLTTSFRFSRARAAAARSACALASASRLSFSSFSRAARAAAPARSACVLASASRWCERHRVGQLADIEPLHIAAYIEQLQASFEKPTVKQRLAAIRMLFDWLVTGQIVAVNPATSVRGPKHVVSWWVRLHEKGGKRHEMPVHHKLEAFLDEYIKAAGIGDEGKSPLFRSAIGLGMKVRVSCHPIQGNIDALEDELEFERRDHASASYPTVCEEGGGDHDGTFRQCDAESLVPISHIVYD
jgi:hypothetical protein